MPTYTGPTKQKARAASTAAENTRSACGALGIDGDHHFLYAAFFFELLARVTKAIAADPARSDYGTGTHVRAITATPRHVRAQGGLDSILVDLAASADRAEALLAAHLRAFERLQGAARDGDEAAVRERGSEAVHYAHLAGRELRTLAGQTRAMSEFEASIQTSGARTGRPDIEMVGPDALAILFLGGLRIENLQDLLSKTRLEDARNAPLRFRGAAKAFRAFGETMADWEIPSESEIRLQED